MKRKRQRILSELIDIWRELKSQGIDKISIYGDPVSYYIELSEIAEYPYYSFNFILRSVCSPHKSLSTSYMSSVSIEKISHKSKAKTSELREILRLLKNKNKDRI